MEDKRKDARVKSVNLLSYVCIDENSNPLDQGMGKTLDISKGGLLMETGVRIDARYILLMSLNIKEELIQIKGKVVYCKKAGPKIFHSGIRFVETDDKIRAVVSDMIKVFIKARKTDDEYYKK